MVINSNRIIIKERDLLWIELESIKVRVVDGSITSCKVESLACLSNTHYALVIEKLEEEKAFLVRSCKTSALYTGSEL